MHIPFGQVEAKPIFNFSQRKEEVKKKLKRRPKVRKLKESLL